ncbi:nucleotidyltransferase family protein [Nonomuraea mesophila]|uniref:Nucleotidyltransferase family protein n=1 Tax=Nonomuraea mesophila TaxID=2530382 RepID=A0A4R5E4Z7_9ACTN|nr:nucleotidyltransferase family protein [Nonomuraea mesophila]TDE24097.1 nucleotidyltransferase family protein [Nonomuraea mesophila]
MRIARLPLDEQLAALPRVLGTNPVLTGVLHQARALGLPGWWVAAGAVVQTVWNHVTGRDPGYGIKDYDLIYYDPSDLSWEAENEVIRSGRRVFGDVPVEIRNEARVHLWYEERFGVPCPPYDSTEDAIASFPATTCALGARITPAGEWRLYAPYGVSGAFDLRLRPNPRLAPRQVYEAKVARWTRDWPELTALPWP